MYSPLFTFLNTRVIAFLLIKMTCCLIKVASKNPWVASMSRPHVTFLSVVQSSGPANSIRPTESPILALNYERTSLTTLYCTTYSTGTERSRPRVTWATTGRRRRTKAAQLLRQETTSSLTNCPRGYTVQFSVKWRVVLRSLTGNLCHAEPGRSG